MTETTAQTHPERTLSALDRCDAPRCGAAAYVAVMVPYGDGDLGELAFCGHHYRENEPALVGMGALVVVDERNWLTARAVGAEVS